MKPRQKLPWVSWGLVSAMALVFGMERRAMGWGIINEMVRDYAFSWTAFLAAPFSQFPNLISHTFLHANASHITSNVIFFLLFAPAVERAVGKLTFVVLYFIWGAVSALTQGFFTPFTSGMIGASGAISGAAGAFFVLYPLRLPPLWLTRVLGKWVGQVPAFFFIGLWFAGQLQDGFRSLMPDPLSGQVTNIAHWAHIGGFAAGAVSMLPFILSSRHGKPSGV